MFIIIIGNIIITLIWKLTIAYIQRFSAVPKTAIFTSCHDSNALCCICQAKWTK